LTSLLELYVAIRSTSCYTIGMTKTIPQRELRNDNARVIDAVVSGERFVITRNGLAVAELVPMQIDRRSFVPKGELQTLAMRGPHVDLEQFRADLDRAIDQRL
jgi:prevent-host-death family protein